MEITPIAVFHSPVGGKFGLPRQAGVVSELEGTIELLRPYSASESTRGLEGFDFLWLIWGFSLNRPGSAARSLTVRPPRLGGEQRVGVFASRSPYRPNSLGLSSVKLVGVDHEKGLIMVKGADLADGTPIYDIKPYLSYTDSHPEAASGFAGGGEWPTVKVHLPEVLYEVFSESELLNLKTLLAQDPRPRYQDYPERVYAMSYLGHEVQFRVEGGELFVLGI